MSLYIKYRPQDFDNLVGQDFIRNTLKNSIINNSLVGAYLFCGPRGTGKTSTARIFAKSINCLDNSNGNPCLKCSICTDFLDEKLIDIIEIDAASHTGVDNIRDLIQKAQYNPTKTKYKVYIIDEVHMLSKGAFNALLKILEEPPTHVKFVLATTETHKVPETILSRCQRYDFKKIGNIDIKNRLEFIAKSEKIKIDSESLEYIIKNSGGGLRNAISLFEQFITDGVISFDNIIQNIGLVSKEKIENFYNLLITGDKEIIIEFEKLIDNGTNIKLFFKELIFTIKEDGIIKIKSNSDISKIIYILENLDDVFIKTKNSLDENTTFLIGILKIINTIRYGENLIVNEKKILNKKNTKESKKENLIEQKEKLEKKEVDIVSNEDISDIFGNKEDKVVEVKKENTSSDFDLNLYINELKKIGAKGGLTMGIRGSLANLVGSNLELKFKTKFALKTINTSENIQVLKQAFENMGFSDGDIILS